MNGQNEFNPVEFLAGVLKDIRDGKIPIRSDAEPAIKIL